MIIDVHGHYTTAPPKLREWRARQIESAGRPFAEPLSISDDEIRETIERGQLRLQRERGTDLVLFSPTAGGMGHHFGDARTSVQWSRTVNDLVHRVCTMFPDNFVGVCQLPQSPGRLALRVHRRTRPLRQRTRVRRMQPQPRPHRRLLDRPAADGPLVVRALRAHGRARGARYGARQHVVQPQLPRHGRALPERRHDGVHAVPHLEPVHGLPHAQVRAAARRRGPSPSTGGATGALPRTWAGRPSTSCCSATSGSTPASTTRRASTSSSR